MHEGICVGGPMAGQSITTVSQTGFIAVDRQAGACWLYYIDASGRYVLCTKPDPSSIDEDGTRAYDPDRGIDAALGPDLDVIALPGDAVEEEGGEGGEG